VKAPYKRSPRLLAEKGSTATKIPVMCSQKRNCAASVPISAFMCLWAICMFRGSVHIFSCSRIGRPILGIYKSLTDTWMWKLGQRPRNSFFGNICFEFSVLCLCSAMAVRSSNHTWLDMRKKLTWGWNAVAAGGGIPARQQSRRRPSRSQRAWSICAATDCVSQRSKICGIRL
jgi:hypothetical protein